MTGTIIDNERWLLVIIQLVQMSRFLCSIKTGGKMTAPPGESIASY